MASVGILNGTAIAIYVGGVKVANLISNDLELSMATRETTNKDTAGWKASAGSTMEWSCSAEGMFAEDAAFTFDDLFAIFIARNAVSIMTSSQVSGDKKYTGSALLTKLSRNHGYEENVTFSCSFEGISSLTEATI